MCRAEQYLRRMGLQAGCAGLQPDEQHRAPPALVNMFIFIVIVIVIVNSHSHSHSHRKYSSTSPNQPYCPQRPCSAARAAGSVAAPRHWGSEGVAACLALRSSSAEHLRTG